MCKMYCLYLLTVYGLAAGAAQNSENGCVLPAYPPHGNYTVDGRPEAVPGQTYDFVSLTVTCDPGYGVVGSNATYCSFRNIWRQPMPQCIRFCRLTPHPSVKYYCKITGEGVVLSGTRECHKLEPNGTVVVPECNRPVYYSSGLLLDMHCVDGVWNHVPICQPDCGTSTASGEQLIINGARTERGELPWHAGVYDKTYTPLMQICGGSLISTQVVISAAHCFWKDGEGRQPASRYSVALGKIYRSWGEVMDSGAHKSDVSEIKIPDRFLGEAAHFQEDIALVFMSTPVVYSTYIRPVCIDFSEGFDKYQLQSTHSGRVTGWGLTAADGLASQVLLTAEMPYVDVVKCIAGLPDLFQPYVTSDKICAGDKRGTTVCRGDSGGGLVFPSMERGTRRYFLRGVVSMAPRTNHNCNANTYVTFTRILAHATFIKDNGLDVVSTHQGPVDTGRCVLPAYPPHGTYFVYTAPAAAPGQTYDSAVLTVSCNPGYEVVGGNITYCFGGNNWQQPMPQCVLIDVDGLAAGASQSGCIARNTTGSKDGIAAIFVCPKPSQPTKDRLTISPSALNVVEGQSTNVICTGTASIPVDSIGWVRQDGSELAQNLRSENGVLYIDVARHENHGVYVCQTTSGQASSVSILVTVDPLTTPPLGKAPSISASASQVKIPTGGNRTIDCNPQGYPTPYIEWTKHNDNFGPGTSQRGNTLIITNAQEEDRGYYICSGYVDGDVIAQHLLMVDIETRIPPKVEIWPQGELAVTLGGQFELHCRVLAGVPPPDILWSRRSSPSTHLQPFAVLKFDRIEVNDEGEYICTAINSAGQDSANATLKLRSVPESVLRAIEG